MSAIQINAARKKAGLPLIRYPLTKLSPEDINDLRHAYQAAYDITLGSSPPVADARGFWGIARAHGFDLSLCHVNSRYFLTWHRAYVYFAEKLLNAALKQARGTTDIELTLPYWDWTVNDPDTHDANGIPSVLNEPTYADNDQTSKNNPLYSGPSYYRARNGGPIGLVDYTSRDDAYFYLGIPQLRAEVARYMSTADYMTFNQDFDFGAHGQVHVSVGGDMGQVISAAYDPIFYLHHCMVDKVWADWQSLHGNSTVPKDVRDNQLNVGPAGTVLTGEFVLDYQQNLKYVYSTSAPVSAVFGARPSVESLAKAEHYAMPDAIAPRNEFTKLMRFCDIDAAAKGGRLELHSAKPPVQSYTLRAFINNPDADAKTPTDDPSFGGSVCFFGHGECFGADGHCDPNWSVPDRYSLQPKHHFRRQKTTYSINISQSVAAMGMDGPEKLDVYLVLINADQHQVSMDELTLDDISFVSS